MIIAVSIKKPKSLILQFHLWHGPILILRLNLISDEMLIEGDVISASQRYNGARNFLEINFPEKRRVFIGILATK